MTMMRVRKGHYRCALVSTTLLSFVSASLRSSAARAQQVTPDILSIDIGTGGATNAGLPTSLASEPAALATTDLSTGAAKASYAFTLPRARGEAQPSLGLRYNSSSGIGFAGVGWTLDLPSVVRRGQSAIPEFQDAIYFPSSNSAQDDDYYVDGRLLLPVPTPTKLPPALVSVSGTPVPGVAAQRWTMWQTEVDDGNRYFFDATTWVMQTKSGHLIEFGAPIDGGAPSVEVANAIAATTLTQSGLGANSINPIYRWNLVRDHDASENTVYYVWSDLEQDLFKGTSRLPTTDRVMYLTDIYDTAPLGSAGGNGGGAPGGCPSGEVTCNGACTDTQSDAVNCGGCGSVCGSGQACQQGNCKIATCPEGHADCDGNPGNGCEVDITSDPNNCGGCNQVCGAGISCTGGLCVSGATCAGVSTQACGNCGTQTRTCNAGTWSAWGACIGAGACVAGATQNCATGGTQSCGASCQWSACSCPTGQTVCGSACTNLQTDTSNCGSCGTACAAGTSCTAGACKKSMGSSCASGSDCATGICAQSVCCETACSGSCQSCAIPGMSGICETVPGGLPDPAGVCKDQGAASCGTNGLCNGGGGCALYPSGATCAAGSCPAGGSTLNSPRTCDGNGTCRVASTTSCVPFACNATTGACAVSCASNAGCATGNACIAGSCGTCPTGKTACSGACVSEQSDPSNCGSCGHACATGSTCTAGACTPTCGSGQSLCSGACTNLQTDNKNCGVCGTACTAGATCFAGACKTSTGSSCTSGSSCASGICAQGVCCATACSGSCQSCALPGMSGTCNSVLGGTRDPAGVCKDQGAASCGTNGLCKTGGGCALYPPGATCAPASCPAGQSFVTEPRTCDGNGNCGAASTMSCTPFACNAATGGCGGSCASDADCATGNTCTGGNCAPTPTCASGQTLCGGACTNVQTDTSNCGACGAACASGQSCLSGHCCGAGQGWCLSAIGIGSCTDLQSNNASCGVCGNACGGGSCVSGACVCQSGFTLCGSRCVNLSGNPGNCGACGNVCPSGQSCCNGVCGVDFQSDPNNCGGCGVVCSSNHIITPTCTTGLCSGTCQSGTVDCNGNLQTDGCEAVLSSDPLNCGACGAACASGQTCNNGTCCTPQCSGSNCFDNGCGGVCGQCPNGTVCQQQQDLTHFRCCSPVTGLCTPLAEAEPSPHVPRGERSALACVVHAVTSAFEGTAHADPIAGVTFAHHVRFSWDHSPNLVSGASPIWKASYLAQLTAVDVTSAMGDSTSQRRLVRRYDLTYKYNDTTTRAYLSQIQMTGDCDDIGGVSEGTDGHIADGATSTCTKLPASTYDYFGVTLGVGAAPAALPTPVGKPKFDFYYPLTVADIDGDSLVDVIGFKSEFMKESADIAQPFPAIYTDLEISHGNNVAPAHWPAELNGNGLMWTDLLNHGAFGEWGYGGALSLLWFLPKGALCGASDAQTCGKAPLDLRAFSLTTAAGGQAYLLDPPENPPPTVSLPAGVTTALGNLPLGKIGRGAWQKGRFSDVDGDGLPDMMLTTDLSSSSTSTPYRTYFTAGDRVGNRYAMSRIGPGLCPTSLYDPFNYGAQGTPYGDRGISFQGTKAMADLDGDGLADLVVVSKDTSNKVVLGILPSRGDGRYGYPNGAKVGADGWSPPAGAFAPWGCGNDNTFGAQRTVTTTTALGPDPVMSAVYRFGDLNGDGFADMAVLEQDALWICLFQNAGQGQGQFACTSDDTIKGTDHSQPGPQADIEIGDVYGSGISQVIYFPANIDPALTDPRQVGSSVPKLLRATAISVAPDGNTTVGPGQTVPRNGLLQTISNGVGATTTFTYDTIANSGGVVPSPQWVVKSLTTSNNMGNDQDVSIATTFTYVTPIYDPRDRQFVGFRSVIAVRDGVNPDSSSPGTWTKTTFATTTCTTSAQGCPGGDTSLFHFTRGLPVLVETREFDDPAPGLELTSVLDDYVTGPTTQSLDGRSILTIQSTRRHTYLWDENSQIGTPSTPTVVQPAGVTIPTVNLPSVELVVDKHLDRLGNLTDVIDYGRPSDQHILTHYFQELPTNDATGWSYRVAVERTSYATIATDSLGQMTATVSQPDPVREYDYSYDPLGRLTKVQAKLTNSATMPEGRPAMPPNAPASGLVTLQSLDYEPSGNVATIGSDQNPCKTRIVYDMAFDQLPKAVTAYPGGCGSPGLVSTPTYDRRFDAMTSTASYANEVTTYVYDEFGRIRQVSRPSPDAPSVPMVAMNVTYDDTGPTRHVHAETAGGPVIEPDSVPSYFVKHDRYYDGFGELRAAFDQESVIPGNLTASPFRWVLSGLHTSFDNGRVASTYRPLLSSGAWTGGDPTALVASGGWAFSDQVCSTSNTCPPTATASYDGAGRVVSTTDFLGNASTWTYHTAALQVDVLDREQVPGQGSHNAVTTVTRDGHARLVTVDRNLSNTASGAAHEITSYDAYEATGEPKQITHGGQTRKVAYDSLGRMVVNNEPNSGTWLYAYDADGRLAGTSDARGCGQNLFYDGIGRLVARDSIPCPAPSGWMPADLTSGDNTEAYYQYDPTSGRLTDVYDLAHHDSYGYDARGRIISIGRQIVAPIGVAPPATALTGRYTAQTFTKQITYDVTDAVLTETTGATSPELNNEGTTETRNYGVDGRLQSIQLTGGAAPVSILAAQTYNPDGSLATQRFGDAATIKSNILGTGRGTRASYGYDDNGTLTGYRLFRDDGPWASVTPSAASDPNQATEPTQQGELVNLTITPDLVGNPLSSSDASAATWPGGAQSVSQTYDYWDDYRLEDVSSNGAGDVFVSPTQADAAYYPPVSTANVPTRFEFESFGYDLRGNVVSSSDDLSNDFFERSLGTSPVRSGNDQLQSTQSTSSVGSYNAISAVSYTAGNLTGFTVSGPSGESVYAYTWDEVGRLASASRQDTGASSTSVSESYVYDAGGNRVVTYQNPDHSGAQTYTIQVFDSLVLKNAQAVPSTTTPTTYTYQVGKATEQVYLAGGTARMFYDNGTGGSALPSVGGNNVHIFMRHADPRGSTSFVIDHDSGELVERTAYQPYGALDADYRPARWASNREDLKFGGHWDNAEVGLVYMGARYYAPELMRFISPDPLTIHSLQADPNPYAYASGNPIRYSDPLGLDDGGDDEPGDTPTPQQGLGPGVPDHPPIATIGPDGTITFPDDPLNLHHPTPHSPPKNPSNSSKGSGSSAPPPAPRPTSPITPSPVPPTPDHDPPSPPPGECAGDCVLVQMRINQVPPHVQTMIGPSGANGPTLGGYHVTFEAITPEGEEEWLNLNPDNKGITYNKEGLDPAKKYTDIGTLKLTEPQWQAMKDAYRAVTDAHLPYKLGDSNLAAQQALQAAGLPGVSMLPNPDFAVPGYLGWDNQPIEERSRW